MSKNRRKAEAENRARLDRHSNEKAIATRQANHQREVALGRERLDGLFPVRMPSLLEEMDSHEVTSRGGLPRHYTTQPPAFVPRTQPPAFVPPRFQPSLVREIETMSYTSPHIVNVRKLGSKGKQQLALALPPDIVEAIGFEHLASMRFSVELDEGGMTFRAGGGGRPIAVPTWATKKVGAR